MVLTTTGLLRPLHHGQRSCRTLPAELLSNSSLVPPQGMVCSSKASETTTLSLRREYVMPKSCSGVPHPSPCHSARARQSPHRIWIEYCLSCFFAAHGIQCYKQVWDLDRESPATRIYLVDSQIGRFALSPNQLP